MDEVLDTNALGTVQFISVFTYLYAMSDFLYTEEYLLEIDQNKQIPVVNALYQYLEDHHDNQSMKLKLIRHLLKGSDLYGEQENEEVDIIFVNTMFDYIIKSLVFNKYGNIYGFLADVVRNTTNLELNFVLEKIFFNLKNATFDNEYGTKSSLTPLAVNRIFTDIIKPLFPQSNKNLNILDIDYIFAQAGLNFIKTGSISNVYYTDQEIFNSTNEEILFNEYLTTGLIIGSNLSEKRSLATLQAFALPALFLYVSKVHVKNENITNIVFDPQYWEDVYETFFSYVDNFLTQQNNEWIKDTNYPLYTELLKFYKHLEKAKNVLNTQCEHLDLRKHVTVPVPILSSVCALVHLPFSYETFKRQVNHVSELFKKHDLISLRQSFEKSLSNSVNYDNVIIHLLAPNDNVIQGIFDKSARLPYDLFEFYYSENETTEYYAVMRDNLTTTLIKLADNSQDFQEAIGISVEVLLKHRFHRVQFKSTEETIDLFLLKFSVYKKLRLESYLTHTDTGSSLGEWWKEFGLNLIPFLQLEVQKEPEDPYGTNDSIFDEIKYFFQFPENMSQMIIQNETRTLISSAGMTLKTILLKNATENIINAVGVKNEYLSQLEAIDTEQLLQKITLHLEEPAFGINSMTKENLIFLNTIISALQEKNIYPFLNIQNYLNNLLTLKSYNLNILEIAGNKVKRVVFVKSANSTNSTNTSYGYKFIHLDLNQTAHLRTIFKEDNKNFITLIKTKQDGEKIYSVVQNDTFQLQEKNIFEIGNQLRRDVNEFKFTGIPTNFFVDKNDKDYNCKEKMGIKIITNNALFIKLKCDIQLEIDNLKDSDGERKINAIYSFRDRKKIEIGRSFVNIVTDFNIQRALFTVSFEDYYAIRNFATTGYSRIMESTHEATYMKLALYKLALRQFDDQSDKFLRILYRTERIPNAVVNKTFSVGGKYTFRKFVTTHEKDLSAINFADVAKSGYKNVLFEMKFTNPYFNVKIRKFYYSDETISILLPGSEFTITSVEETQIFNVGDFLRITLLYKDVNEDKYDGYNSILEQISRLGLKS